MSAREARVVVTLWRLCAWVPWALFIRLAETWGPGRQPHPVAIAVLYSVTLTLVGVFLVVVRVMRA